MGKLFNKAMFGFKQEQVIAYIDALVERQKQALSLEKEKNHELNSEIDKLLLKIDLLEENQDSDQLSEKIANQEQLIDKLKNDKEKIFQSLKDVKAEMNVLQNENIKYKKILESKNGLVTNDDALLEVSEPLNDTDDALQQLQYRIYAIDQEFSKILVDIKKARTTPNNVKNLQDILDKIKRIGEKV